MKVKSLCIYFFLMAMIICLCTEVKTDDDVDADSDAKEEAEEPAVETPRNVLADLLYKGQFFQDIFSEQLTPERLQFGHVCENPHEWEQRFEQKDLKNNHFQGKVKWGNINGGYGEHYYDLNHANGNVEEEEEK